MIEYRNENNYTQRYIAYKMGVSQQAVGKWENGHAVPRSALLPKLAGLIGCTIDELLSESTVNAPSGEG
ncbi:MAG: helix-turn-helix domain-containing protein [Acutalibacteraceae bacterium]